jgi:ABC-type proline/glycine betaine transport system ATPase subunit
VAILNKGKIEQVGTPAQIVNHPATEFVAEFVDGIDLKRINTEASSPAAQLTRNLKIVS